MRFCSRNNCNNVLTTVMKPSTMVYRCLVCFEEYPLSDQDTLVIDEILQESNTVHKYQTYLRNAHADSIVELARKKCPTKDCPETIVHVIKVSQNGQSMYICPICKHQFL
ncbi:hypothetical protein GQ600_3322 [Phytophthora cactorum]|nr:hypothetical protein GQ600_3322 [Phytophthora cactorum]